MVNDTEAKRLADWKIAAKKYCDLLEEMAEELRRNINDVPNSHVILLALDKKNEEALRAGRSFQENIRRLRALVPLSDAR
jgi:hypothetical protein